MPKFIVEAGVTVSAYTIVDASTEEDAIKIARQRRPVLCPHGPSRSGVNAEEEFIIEDADGELRELKAQLYRK